MEIKWPYLTWDNANHCIHIGNEKVQLTPSEYKIARILAEGATTFDQLSRHIYGCNINKQRMICIDQHITRMRAKMALTGIYIYCIYRYGYILLPEIIPYFDICRN